MVYNYTYLMYIFTISNSYRCKYVIKYICESKIIRIFAFGFTDVNQVLSINRINIYAEW